MFHRPKSEEKQVDITNFIQTPATPQASAPAPTAATAPARPQVAVGSSPAIPFNTQPQQTLKKAEDKTMSEDQAKQQPRPIDIPVPASNYQAQPTVRTPGNQYSAASFSSPSNPLAAAKPVAAQGRRLVIGEGISLSGEIEACEYLVIEGTVEAALKGASVLEIAQNGTFYGTVEIDEATVAGRFEGDITVNGRLTITSTGSVTGTISYKELAVEAGATVDGKINPLSGSKAASGKKSDKAGKTVKGPRNDNADEGSQLPFSASAAASA